MTRAFARLLPIAVLQCVLAVLTAAPARADTLEEVKAQLAAQKQINALLKQRIMTLESEREGRKIPPPAASATAPKTEADDPEQQQALERALVRRGTALLPPGVYELSPGFVWSHAGGGYMDPTQDVYAVALDARVGVKGGWMLGATVPFLHREATGGAGNTGISDISATVWKSLMSQTESRPSVVASLRYTAPTGENFGSAAVPLGNGFHTLQSRLSLTKSSAPVAFFGDLSYTAYLGEAVRRIELGRNGAFGFSLGTSLAVTPDISMSAGVNFSFERNFKVSGISLPGTSKTQGSLDLGIGVVLSHNLFLTISGAFGVTHDAPDVAIGVSLPVRF